MKELPHQSCDLECPTTHCAQHADEEDQPTWRVPTIGVGPDSKGGQLTISRPLFGRQFTPSAHCLAEERKSILVIIPVYDHNQKDSLFSKK